MIRGEDGKMVRHIIKGRDLESKILAGEKANQRVYYVIRNVEGEDSPEGKVVHEHALVPDYAPL